MKIVTKTDGSVDANYKYEPYGALLAAKSTGTDITKYKYTGQEEDSGTGLYNYSTRFYDPEIGRFISPDSMVPDPGDTQAFNRYMYANNNPVRFNDPTGHYSEEGGADPGDYTSPYQNQPTYNYTNNTANSSNYTNYSLFNFNFNNQNLFQNTAKTNENLGTWRTSSPVEAATSSVGGLYAAEKDGTIEQKKARKIVDGDEGSIINYERTKNNKFLQNAEILMNEKVPYIYGGRDRKGFDCSGLVDYNVGLMGYSYYNNELIKNMDAKGINEKISYKIAESNLMPGDLAFGYNRFGNIDHVMIYKGNNTWISTVGGPLNTSNNPGGPMQETGILNPNNWSYGRIKWSVLDIYNTGK